MASGGGSNKEMKTLLKSAREAIRNKEYKEALKHCKGVLKLDKGNYNALVFIGVAAAEMGQPDQAVMAYKKAIDTDSEQLLAWQGLSGFYEKSEKEEYKPELVGVYKKMMDLLQGKDQKKWAETTEKLITLCVALGNTEEALTYLKSLIDERTKAEGDTLDYWKQVADILAEQKVLTEENKSQLRQAYSVILQSSNLDKGEHVKYYSGYIKLLQKTGVDDTEIIKECNTMHGLFPSEFLPLQVLAKIHLKCPPESLELSAVDVYEKLLALQEKSGLALLGLGQRKLKDKNYMEARKLLQQGTDLEKSNIHGWLYLAKSQVGLHDNHAAELSCSEGVKHLKARKNLSADEVANLKRAFSLCKADALLDSGITNNVQTAIQIYEKYSDGDSSVLIQCKVVQAYIALEDLTAAQQICDEAAANSSSDLVNVVASQGLLLMANKMFLEAEQKLLEATKSAAGESGLCHYWLGRLYWEMGEESRKDKTKCLGTLLKAAKLDPYNSNTFVYLGHYYWKIIGDKSKGKKCYQKGYELNPRNEEAGAALGDVYLQLGEEELAKELYLTVTSAAAAGTAKWAWLRLGLCYLKLEEANNAISSFQAALRADPKDRHCWECLGEAYMARGSFTAALKAFTRGTELDPSAVYCMFQIAAIKQTLGAFSEAVAEYQIILDISPDYIPALKGQGEAYVCLAKASLQQFFTGRAVDYVQLAVRALARAARLKPDLACVWKLLGDACTLLHPLDSQLISITVPVSLLSSQQKTEDAVVQTKVELLALGARCYGRAVRIQGDCASLWHDLGVNYYHQAKNDIKKEDKPQLLDKSLQCVKKAISLDSTNHVHWTALGVVSVEAKQFQLAQHSFIKSIQVEPQNVVAWTNLGTLYLNQGNAALAHEAFKTSQSLDPAYVQCWIGQALIAETIGSEETMDLFRHTTELFTHMESSIGYAHWVCKTLLDADLDKKSDLYCFNIVQMNALPAAAVAVGKYADCASSDPCAHTMLGLLLERQGLYKAAEKAYRRALDLIQETSGKDEKNLAFANHARSLCMCDRYEEAVKVYQAISPLIQFSDIVGLAVALYKMDDFSASYQAYEQALQLASSEADKSQILSAMGMVAYKSGNIEQAKTLLFKSCQLSSPSVDGLFALCSLGLVSGDVTLATAAVTELQKWQDKEEGETIAMDLGFLSAMMYALQGHKDLACRQVAKLLKKHSHRGELWNLSAELTLQLSPNQAQKAISYSKTAVENFTLNKDIPLVNAACEIAAGSPSCLKTAQKSVHLYPDNLNNWATLAASAVSRCTWDSHKGVPCKSTSAAVNIARFIHEEAVKTGESKLSNWSATQVVWSLVQCGKLDEAQSFCQKIESELDAESDMKSFLQLLQVQILYLYGVKGDGTNVESVRNEVIDKASTSQGWQFLAEVYKNDGLLAAAEVCYRHALQRESTNQAVVLLRLAHLALITHKASEDKEKWLSLAKEAISEALKLKPNNPVALLLQGLLHLQSHNTKHAKRSFLQAMESSHQPNDIFMRSVTRFQLAKIFVAKKDTEAVEILLQEAAEECDPNLKQLQALAPKDE